MIKKIKVFTSSKIENCPACNTVKRLFDDNLIEYEEIDVVTNKEERRRMFKKTHSFKVPIIEIGEDFFIGASNKTLYLIIKSLKSQGLWKQKRILEFNYIEKSHKPINYNKIMWIVSYPKSGSTRLRSFLSTYYFTKTDNFTFDLLEKIPHFLRLDSFGRYLSKFKDQPEKIAEYWIPVQRENAFTHGVFNLNIEFFATHNKNGTLNDNLFIDAKKTAGYINIIRDPRDVVVSYSRYLGCSIDDSIDHITTDGLNITEENDFPEFRLNWYKNYMSWKEQGEKDGYPGIVVRYEDLLRDSFKYFSKIIKFLTDDVGCGTYDEDKIKRCIKSTSFENMKRLDIEMGCPLSNSEMVDIKNNVIFRQETNEETTFFSHGTSGHWKDILTKKQRERIENKFKKEMLYFGYDV